MGSFTGTRNHDIPVKGSKIVIAKGIANAAARPVLSRVSSRVRNVEEADHSVLHFPKTSDNLVKLQLPFHTGSILTHDERHINLLTCTDVFSHTVSQRSTFSKNSHEKERLHRDSCCRTCIRSFLVLIVACMHALCRSQGSSLCT